MKMDGVSQMLWGKRAKIADPPPSDSEGDMSDGFAAEEPDAAAAGRASSSKGPEGGASRGCDLQSMVSRTRLRRQQQAPVSKPMTSTVRPSVVTDPREEHEFVKPFIAPEGISHAELVKLFLECTR